MYTQPLIVFSSPAPPSRCVCLGTYGDHLTLIAAGTALRERFIVVDGTGDLILTDTPPDRADDAEDVWLAYYPLAEHYRSTTPLRKRRRRTRSSKPDLPDPVGESATAWLLRQIGAGGAHVAVVPELVGTLDSDGSHLPECRLDDAALAELDAVVEGVIASAKEHRLAPSTKKTQARIKSLWEEFVRGTAARKDVPAWAVSAGIVVLTGGTATGVPYPQGGVKVNAVTSFLMFFYRTHSGRFGHARPGLETMLGVEACFRTIVSWESKFDSPEKRNEYVALGPSVIMRRNTARGSQDRRGPWDVSVALTPMVRQFGKSASHIHRNRYHPDGTGCVACNAHSFGLQCYMYVYCITRI